jgi:hypothetical protein
MVANADFQPDFYAALAAVLPVLLLVTNLAVFYVQQRGQDLEGAAAMLNAPLLVGALTGRFSWRTYAAFALRAFVYIFPLRLFFTVTAVVLNVVAEIACLIVLFVRSASTAVNVIIWFGFGISMVWVVTSLLLYLAAMSRLSPAADGPSESGGATGETPPR